MNSQLYEADSSTGMDQYVEDHINKLRSWQARNRQKHKNNDLRVQNNESLNTSSKPIQQHKAQQTDNLHLDGHLLYTMIARLNAVFTQLITEIQQHHLTQSDMLQTAHTSLPFQNNRRPAPRRTKRRHQIRKCYRCRQHGHRAAECEAQFPCQEDQNSQHTGDTTLKFIKKTHAHRKTAFPQYTLKTTIKQEGQDYSNSTSQGMTTVVSCGPMTL